MTAAGPTGRFQFRRGFLGRMVLQIEYIWHGIGAYERPTPEGIKIDRFKWRDATEADLRHRNLRGLLEREG